MQPAGERIARCEAAMNELLGKWRLEPAVRALMAMKGFQTVAAMIVVRELGAYERFSHPRQVMAFLGLIRSEHSSSNKRRQGAITKCGMRTPGGYWWNPESFRGYAAPPKVSKELSRRQRNLSRAVRLISWKAQKPVTPALLPVDGASDAAQ